MLVQEIARNIQLVQEAFIVLLTDPKATHLSREACCLGLAAVRGIAGAFGMETEGASADLTKRVLRAFGQTKFFCGSAFMETAAQAAERRATERGIESLARNETETTIGDENEVGGSSGIGEAALAAYREMAAASVALGRLDIFYGLLILSVSHPCWFSAERKDHYR